jgi:hypothetical protein
MPIVMIFIVNTNFEMWKTKNNNDKNSHSQNLTHQPGLTQNIKNPKDQLKLHQKIYIMK